MVSSCVMCDGGGVYKSRCVEFPDVAGWRRPEWTEMQELKEKGGVGWQVGQEAKTGR